MKRQHPLFSPLGCGMSFLLIAALIVSALLTGGAMFSPGQVSASASRGVSQGGFSNHAQFENECDRCHMPWSRSSNVRCLTCHQDIQDDITAGGLHSRLPETLSCADCHSEHHGREYSSRNTAIVDFQHDWTGFSLDNHHRNFDGTPLQCTACHGVGYSFASQTCDNCHREANSDFMHQHVAEYGEDCLACHKGSGEVNLEVAHASFPLTGGHGGLECVRCHPSGIPFGETPAQCVACHEDPEIHRGQFGTDCAACHTIDNWHDAKLTSHNFPLNHGKRGGGNWECSACHPVNYVEYTCYGSGCHSESGIRGEHIEEGIRDYEDCLRCHPTGREGEGEREGGDD